MRKRKELLHMLVLSGSVLQQNIIKKKTTTDTSILSEVAGPDWNGLNS